MCIVIDANVAHRMRVDDAAGARVLTWLLAGGGRLVVSARLMKELIKTPFRDVMAELSRSARVFRVDDESCNSLSDELAESCVLKSNDGHIIALIVVSKCRLLFSHDQKLHEDVKNKDLVLDGCAIYQEVGHGHLLDKCICK